jgi:mono/diheme cytochrome c family protein
MLIGGTLLTTLAVLALAADTPTKLAVRLGRCSGTAVLLPAAWLAAVNKADGSGRLMSMQNLRRLGFLVDAAAVDGMNPYGWPLGFTVSAPRTSGEIPMAGLTCAACHTGQIEYKGTAIRIEGGQSMIDLTGFFSDLVSAFVATAADPSRQAQFFEDAIKAGYPADKMEADFRVAAADFGRIGQAPPGAQITGVEAGPGRSDAVQGIANRVLADDLGVPTNYKNRDAPTSFPYLWDIWRLSWLQSNGFLPGTKTTSRNIGTVLGVNAKTNFVNPDSGEVNPEPLRWQTSVQLENIVWIENTLQGLKAPTWPADILGPIDETRADKGKELFRRNCAGCHGIEELPNGRWDVTVSSLQQIGTDPVMTTNWASLMYDVSKLGLSKKTTGFDAIVALINPIRRQLYADANTPPAEQETDAAFEAPCGYRARPLIGAWATPPFLHNGSVRTIFDLLSDVRPTKFTVGSREYDPVNLGYAEDQSVHPFVLDTSIPGNGNAGHWFTDDGARLGRIGPKLADADKYDIIEFLKAANYDNYPSEIRAKEAILPCQGQKDWAFKK